MVCEGMEQAFGLAPDRIALQPRGTREGDTQGDGVLWTDEAKARERSPDAGRETLEERGGLTRWP